MDIILYNIGTAIILFLIGYLLGSIPNAIWIGKLFFHKDPRDFGSGNAGGTNAGRIFGKKVGLIVIILDMIKVIIPLYVSWIILVKAPIYNGAPLMNTVEEIYAYGINDAPIQWPVYWMVAVGCSIGHCFPVFAHFRGGKNVSTFMGTGAGSSWLTGFLLGGATYLLVLKWKKYVSLASIVTSWVTTLLAWIWAILILTGVLQGPWAWFTCYGPSLDCNWVYALTLTISATLLTIQHRSNIQRLRDGVERKIKWMK